MLSTHSLTNLIHHNHEQHDLCTKSSYGNVKSKKKLSIAEFMQFALYDPIYGYYCTRNPFGINGDFVTSPEICSLFGECLGIFIVHAWHNLQQPSLFELIELGGGRGIMMKDILHIIKQHPQCYNACQIRIIEISPRLQKVQAENLHEHKHKIQWDDHIKHENEQPKIFISNEFFDALSIRQFVIKNTTVFERHIAYNAHSQELQYDDLNIETQDIPLTVQHKISQINAPTPFIIEYSQASHDYIEQITNILDTCKGIFLTIDYGYNEDMAYGDTLQSVKDNKYSPIFSDIGQSDYTAHIDFHALSKTVLKHNGQCGHIITQNLFLQSMGIEHLLQRAIKQCNLDMKQRLNSAVKRITDEETAHSMGHVFKCLFFCDQTTSIIYPFN